MGNAYTTQTNMRKCEGGPHCFNVPLRQ